MVYPPNIVNNDPGVTAQPAPSEKQYYMSVNTKIYGPYTADLMQNYITESRLGPQSLMSDHPYAGFKQAQLWPEFQAWSRSINAESKPLTSAPPSVFIVIADIQSENNTAFINLLFSLGIVKTLSYNAWIISAPVTIDELRDTLSRSLSVTDKLFIHDSFSNRAGWFNIGDELDAEIRDLWMKTAKKRKAMKDETSS